MRYYYVLPTIVLLSACHKNSSGKMPQQANSNVLQVITLDPDQYGYQFGQGINSLTSEPNSVSCITFEPPTNTMGSEGARGYVSVETIKTTKEFHEKIGRDFAVNIGKTAKVDATKTMDKLTGKASMSTKSLSETHINKEYSYALLKAEKIWMPSYIRNIKMKPEIIEKYTNLPVKHKEFFKECGDSFIYGTKFSAHVFALLECESSSIESKTLLEKKLEASIGTDTLSAGGSLATSLDRAIKDTNSTCRALVEYVGGSGSISSAEPLEAFRSAISYVNGATLQNSVPTELNVKKYSEVNDPAWNFKPWGWTLNFPTQEMYINDQKTKVNTLSLDVNKLETEIKQSDISRDHEKVKQLYAQKKAKIKTLVLDARDLYLCATNPTTVGYCNNQLPVDENEQPIFEEK